MDKILVVDDDIQTIKALQVWFKKYTSQFETLFASSADEAVNILKKERIAVLVTDLVMPGKDGLDLFAYKDRYHPKVQCIIMTGHGTDEIKKTANSDGAFCYLGKPFKLSELSRAIMVAIEARDEGRLFIRVSLKSLLHLIKAKKKTCLLEVSHSAKENGAFYFEKGRLADARYKDLVGEDAAIDMIGWDRVNFQFQKLSPDKIEHRIEKDLPNLLLKQKLLKEENISKETIEKVTKNNEPISDFDDLLEETLSNVLDELNVNENDDNPKNDKIDVMGFVSGLVAIEPSKAPCRLLIVDDSKMMRKMIAEVFKSDDSIEVVGECTNGKEALEMVNKLNVDVMTLDVEMPVMDGLTTLKHLMIQHPIPTVMISSLTQEGASATFDALKLGAVDFVAKPSMLSDKDMMQQSAEISRKVKLAADVEIDSIHYIRAPKSIGNEKSMGLSGLTESNRIFAIGAAEGGYGALLKIIPQLPNQFQASCLITIHAEPPNVDAFAKYLGKYSMVTVRRARDGEQIKSGCCYLSSGEENLTIHSIDTGFFFRVNPDPSYNMRSSINMMMFSVAETMGSFSTGVILSGSGDDGCEGMKRIAMAGGSTIVQDPKSCVYKQMAESVLNKNRVDMMIPDKEIASAILKRSSIP